MPPLPGFSDNPLRVRRDVEEATIALLQSLCKYQSTGAARIKIPVAIGTHFDEVAAQLEGFARPLWAVAALQAGSDPQNTLIKDVSMSFARGLANGTNPEHSEYWGPVVVSDQRMVEMEIISFALLAAPEIFYNNQTSHTKANIKSWLMTINGKDMPVTNWRWFRVLTNLALVKVCDVPTGELRGNMDADLDLLETFYLTDGWSSDGVWSEAGKQADYYSGSFAIQFSQMMYVKFAESLDPVRCKVFRERAYMFSKDFHHFFSLHGAAIPFGRSLTYRFAFAGFWAAGAYAGIELSSPVHSLGAIKGFLLRHLRWWTSKPDIFNADGTLNIGYTYPNMYMCEDYNSPQSVYWCMKSLCCLGLPASHPFWTIEEQDYPLAPAVLSHAVRAPMQIVCNSGSHHFLLSSGQFCPWPLKATEAKYGKFAYSSHFGFSVPTGSLIQQIAPDSTLALKLRHDDTWKTRWITHQPKFSTAILHTNETQQQIPVLVGNWRPWRFLDVEVCSVLIPPTSRWPEWHLRIHKIIIKPEDTPIHLETVEGGFAINGRQLADSLPVQPRSVQDIEQGDNAFCPPELSETCDNSCLVISTHGMSGIREISPQINATKAGLCHSQGNLLKPDSNTNLICQRTLIPTIKSSLSCEKLGRDQTFYLVSAIFAADTFQSQHISAWKHCPNLDLGFSSILEKSYIKFTDW